MAKARVNKTKYRKPVAIVLLLVLLIVAGFLALQLWENSQGTYDAFNPQDPYVEYGGKEYKLKDNVETFLLLGLDTFSDDAPEESYNNNKQADFLMLFVLDNDSKMYSAIQINRDTIANVDVLGVAGNRIDTVKKQIALAHTYGNGKEVSCRNTARAVSDLLLGVKVDHFASVTMDAVPLYNDLLGGVEVEVLADFAGIDDTLKKGETVTLKGEQALTYVRGRQGLEDNTNIARMERQRQYMNALLDKSATRFAEDEQFAVDATLQMADYMVSDRTVNQLQELLDRFSSYEFTGICAPQGESRVGEFMEFYPDEDSVKEIVIQSFYTPKK